MIKRIRNKTKQDIFCSECSCIFSILNIRLNINYSIYCIMCIGNRDSNY